MKYEVSDLHVNCNRNRTEMRRWKWEKRALTYTRRHWAGNLRSTNTDNCNRKQQFGFVEWVGVAFSFSYFFQIFFYLFMFTCGWEVRSSVTQTFKSCPLATNLDTVYNHFTFTFVFAHTHTRTLLTPTQT